MKTSDSVFQDMNDKVRSSNIEVDGIVLRRFFREMPQTKDYSIKDSWVSIKYKKIRQWLTT